MEAKRQPQEQPQESRRAPTKEADPFPKDMPREATTDMPPARIPVALPILDADADPHFDRAGAMGRVNASIEFLDMVLTAAVKRTTKRDWFATQSNDPDNPGTIVSLCASGAKKIAPVFGVEFREMDMSLILQGGIPLPQPRPDDWEGLTRWMIMAEKRRDSIVGFEMRGYARSVRLFRMVYGRAPGKDEGWTEIVGGRSAKDKFFTSQRDGVDILDVRKAAHTNWIARAVETVLGLGGMMAEDLAERGHNVKTGADGKPKADATYKAGSQGGAGTKDEQAKRADITGWLEEMTGGDAKTMADMLASASGFDGKTGRVEFRDVKRIKGYGLQKTHATVEALYAAWVKQNGGDADPSPAQPSAPQPQKPAPKREPMDQAERELAEGVLGEALAVIGESDGAALGDILERHRLGSIDALPQATDDVLFGIRDELKSKGLM